MFIYFCYINCEKNLITCSDLPWVAISFLLGTKVLVSSDDENGSESTSTYYKIFEYLQIKSSSGCGS